MASSICSILLTLGLEAQLSADHHRVVGVPPVVAHRAPRTVRTDLHPTLDREVIPSARQPNISGRAGCVYIYAGRRRTFAIAKSQSLHCTQRPQPPQLPLVVLAPRRALRTYTGAAHLEALPAEPEGSTAAPPDAPPAAGLPLRRCAYVGYAVGYYFSRA